MQTSLPLWATLLALCLPSATAAPALRLTAPHDFEVVQRVHPEHGLLPVAGYLETTGAPPDLIEARWKSSTTEGPWTVVRSRGGTFFEGQLSAPAGGWYRLEVRTRRANSVEAEAAIEHVGLGEVFVVAGQSNSANHGEERLEPTTGLVVNFDGTQWRPAKDPQPGASGGGGSFLPPFGDALAQRWHVPIGLIATGVGATSVREWLPRGDRFPNPPTLMGQVVATPEGAWSSRGELYDRFVTRLQQLPPRGFRAVLWHQGESDANQQDSTRTLSGALYRQYLARLMEASRHASGWQSPWFVALVSYHTPDDPGSADIRAAQKSLWDSGLASPGPDSDALTGSLRDGGRRGVHFSGAGLREHGQKWAAQVAPAVEATLQAHRQATAPPPGRLALPGESLTIAGRPAFLYLPPSERRSRPQPWIFYAPTLPPYPDEAERWMHEQFLEAGIAVAGIDVGEAYGSPASHAVFEALYRELVQQRGFAPRPCLLGRSRGGLAVCSWAIAHPERVAGLAGIYPVFDFRTYPGLAQAAPAYGLTAAALEAQADQLNPIERVGSLARARVPAILVHGDEDRVVPLRENSERFRQQYEAAGTANRVRLIVLPKQGHNMFEGFFHSRELVEFAKARAWEGVR